MKFIKDNKCKIINVCYQLLFAGSMFTGGDYYLTEIQKATTALNKLQTTIDHTVDKAENKADRAINAIAHGSAKLKDSVIRVERLGDNITAHAHKLNSATKRISRACQGF